MFTESCQAHSSNRLTMISKNILAKTVRQHWARIIRWSKQESTNTNHLRRGRDGWVSEPENQSATSGLRLIVFDGSLATLESFEHPFLKRSELRWGFVESRSGSFLSCIHKPFCLVLCFKCHGLRSILFQKLHTQNKVDLKTIEWALSWQACPSALTQRNKLSHSIVPNR